MWMALSFYLEILTFLMVTALTSDGEIIYWIGLSHPITRLPVFIMGICAGLLCVRIQNGDIHALDSKKYLLCKEFLCIISIYFQNLGITMRAGLDHGGRTTISHFHSSKKPLTKLRLILNRRESHGSGELTLTWVITVDL